MRKPSFITANYVARAKGYNGEPNWGVHDQATRDNTSADQWGFICRDVARQGFKAIDIWTAHCHWQHHDREGYPERVKALCAENGLEVTSYAGGIPIKKPADLDAPLAFMNRIGAPIFAGGIHGLPVADLAPAVQDACQRHGVRWALENHPEKSADEILNKIGNGKFDRCGVALDTGWCAIQHMDALDATKRVRPSLFILHLKDVVAPGSHDTCAIGEGVVPCEQVVRYLVETNWSGAICIEHEPYDRDPMPEVKRSLERVQQWLRA
jgi:L-ribulose-5-phosphate 3-epimerase